MWFWNALPIDPVTSRSPCLSHLTCLSLAVNFLDSAFPEHVTNWAVTDQKISANDAVKFAVEGRWQILGGFNVCKTSTNISPQNFATNSAAGKTEFRHFPAVTKIRISPFPSQIIHVQNHHFHYPVCLVPPLSQPH